MTLSASNDTLSLVGGGSVSAFDTTNPRILGPNLTPIAVSPAPGALLAQSPTAVTVTFDRPLDPATLGVLDVLIEQQQAGAWVSVFDSSDAPPETLDATGTELSLTHAEPLTTGSYRVVLPERSILGRLDGSAVADLGSDQVLGTFTVGAPGSGISLNTATPLAPPVAHEVSVSGSLDLQDNPGAVDFYEFTLPAGHRWLLGAEILAQEIGSPLLSTLALFDSQGNLISSATIGKPSSPNDPYLFQGLAAGTYYIGVSSSSNVPGTAAGYNPATGLDAESLSPQASGAYQLGIEATPADTPAQVVGFSLQFADPLDPHPTGFSLMFNGSLNTQTLEGTPSPGIELVDQNGGIFPVTAVAQNAEVGQYFFLVDQDLPAGHYSVVVPDGGVTDLAGYTPAAHGEPAGVLATFDVRGQTDPNPNDLGPLYNVVHTGITRSDVLLPGASTTYRFVALSAGAYDINSLFQGGSLSFQIVGAGQAGVGTLGAARTAESFKEFTLQLRSLYVPCHERRIEHGLSVLDADGTDALGLASGQRARARSGSQLLLVDNGRGEVAGPAPMTGNGATGTGSAVTGNTPSPGGAGRDLAAAGFASGANGPNGLFLTLGGTLVGLPSSQNEHVGAVGPSTGTNSPALASNAAGLLQGIGYGKGIARNGYGEDAQSDDVATEPLDPVNGAMAAAVHAKESRPDETVIAAADSLTRAGNAAAALAGAGPRGRAAPRSDFGRSNPRAGDRPGKRSLPGCGHGARTRRACRARNPGGDRARRSDVGTLPPAAPAMDATRPWRRTEVSLDLPLRPPRSARAVLSGGDRNVIRRGAIAGHRPTPPRPSGRECPCRKVREARQSASWTRRQGTRRTRHGRTDEAGALSYPRIGHHGLWVRVHGGGRLLRRDLAGGLAGPSREARSRPDLRPGDLDPDRRDDRGAALLRDRILG